MQLLKSLRPINLLVVFFTVLLVHFQLVEGNYREDYGEWFTEIGTTQRAFVLAGIVTIIAAFSYAINNFFDHKTDEAAGKWGEVSVSTKKIVARILGILALAGIMYYNYTFRNQPCTYLLFAGWMLGFLYGIFASRRKGLIGNLLVAALLGLVVYVPAFGEPTFEFVGNETGYLTFWGRQVHFYALLVFFLNISREWVKDVADLKHDQAHGKGTFAGKVGGRLLMNLAKVPVAASMALMLMMGVYTGLDGNVLHGLALIPAFVVLVVVLLGKPKSHEADEFALLQSTRIRWALVFGLMSLLIPVTA